jgi:hypothetical protein
MKNWFRDRSDTVDTTDSAVAYREGRVDERRRVAPEAVVTSGRAEINAAYERGRDHERRRRRGSPIFGLVVLCAIVVAGGLIYLAVRHGSFTGGGAAVDRSLDSVARTVDAPIKNAAEKTGEALQKAGRQLK